MHLAAVQSPTCPPAAGCDTSLSSWQYNLLEIGGILTFLLFQFFQLEAEMKILKFHCKWCFQKHFMFCSDKTRILVLAETKMKALKKLIQSLIMSTAYKPTQDVNINMVI